MNIHLDPFTEGLLDTLLLHKQGENIFDMGNVAMFPSTQSQSMWRFAKDPKTIRLSNDQHVFNFSLPEGEKEDAEFPLERGEDLTPDKFVGQGFSTGKAQVHRSDPGSIYFTLQEGTKNPTYTFRHTGGNKWRALPKKKAVKKTPSAVVSLPNDMAKQAFAKDFIKCGSIDKMLGAGVENTLNSFNNVAWAPGSSTYAPALASATGALGGAAYHFGKRHLYNTDAENEQEDQENPNAMLKRIAIPAVGLGALGLAEQNLAGPSYQALRHYGKAPNFVGEPYPQN